jgi:hypothetical protein
MRRNSASARRDGAIPPRGGVADARPMRGHETNPDRRRLIAAAGAALAAVTFTARRGDTTLEWTLAACLVVAAIVAMAAARRPDHDPARHRRRRPLAVPATLLAGAFAVAVVVPAFARQSVNTARQDTPQATVRDFLSAAVVDGDGNAACNYLSPRARESFERHSSATPNCETFFASAHLTLGGLAVHSDAQVAALTYRVTSRGASRLVRVSHDGQSLAFLLSPASSPDRNAFHGPATPWRIESSVTALGSRPASASVGRHHV